MEYKTYNVPNCTCGHDHDSLSHISMAVLTALFNGVFASSDDPLSEAALQIEDAAQKVGWVQGAAELDDLRRRFNDDVTGD